MTDKVRFFSNSMETEKDPQLHGPGSCELPIDPDSSENMTGMGGHQSFAVFWLFGFQWDVWRQKSGQRWGGWYVFFFTNQKSVARRTKPQFEKICLNSDRQI
jgi:hypothetical protein